MKQADVAFQKCISPRCGATFDLRDTLVACGKCGDLLDIAKAVLQRHHDTVRRQQGCDGFGHAGRQHAGSARKDVLLEAAAAHGSEAGAAGREQKARPRSPVG